MKSPFPGMDPYLERHWLDVHTSLVTYSRNQLQGQLGDDLIARAEERLIVEDPFGGQRAIGPDVRIVQHGPRGEPARPAGGVAVAEPIVFTLASDPVRQGYVEIIDASTGGTVVTVIEYVSPSNKADGSGSAQYEQKQNECRSAGVNLVEIDLTRTGQRSLLAHEWAGQGRYDSTYQASVWRATRPSQCALYCMTLQQRLPTIRIPLRPTDEDVTLDIQAVVDAAYADGRYGRTIDYSRPPQPALRGDDAAWADTMLREAGKRQP